MPILSTITGTLYNALGQAVTSGRLYITLQQDIVLAGEKIMPTRSSYNIPGSGVISLGLVPTVGASPANVAYLVEYDPDPADTSTAMQKKPGYWMNYWEVPAGGATTGSFVSSLRLSPRNNFQPLGSPSISSLELLEVITEPKVLTSAENGKTVIINTTTATPVTLPTPATGLHYCVTIGAITSAGAHSIQPGAGVTIKGNGLSKAPGAALITGVDVHGDFVELVAENTTTWWIVRSRGSWA